MANDDKNQKSSTQGAADARAQGPEDDANAKAEAAAVQRATEQAETNRLREEASKATASGASEYRVAPGQAIVCLRGHVDENQPISANDFKDKEVALADLVSRGAIVRSK